MLTIKRNQPTLHKEVKTAFDDAERDAFTPQAEDRCETVERNGGPSERRTCTVLGASGLGEWVADPEEWPGLRSLIRMQAERNGPHGRRSRSMPCHISSQHVLLELVRGHSGVENGLYLTLDVQFREDSYCMRKGNAPAVMSILYRTALHMMRTLQGKLQTDVSIGLLRDRIGGQLWILASALP